jgi:UDP-N-acetylglucosamine--N-acetylmuramyl-(pentapeptide) pyrophosphoryl-undecaprenol N-acetylglucosamine transferase
LAFLKSWQLISRLRPQVILGVGGYASGPVLLVASLRGYKTYIWEPNVFPGLTNRLLSRFVGKCIVVFSEAGRYLPEKKVLPMGLPVRPEIEKLAFETKTASVGSQRTRELRVLVFGGSQGARGINQALTSAVASGTDWLEGVQLIHQTGRLDFEDVQRQYVKYNRPNLLAFDFLYDMDQRLRWADLVICRAGASTVAELAAAGKAAILVPFPAASDNHQQKNAEVLHNSQSGKMILQSELSGARVIEEVTYYKEHPDELLLWGRNVRQFHMPLAAERIAKELVESKQ